MLKAAKSQFFLWARILLAVILCLGIFFRFAQIEQKIYWTDEVSTSLRVSGSTLREMESALVDGSAQTIQQLEKYRYPNPEKSVNDTIRSLVVEDVQHPPLFFVLLRSWVMALGNSVTSLRSLAAVFSLLMLPAIWFLCRELFQSQAISWVATALLAISPIQIVYAQEARHYSLWMLTILLSSLALLRALRLNTWKSWALYALSVSAGIYTHLFFALVAIGHGIYTLFVNRFKWTRTLASYLLASVVAVLSFIPWLIPLVNRDKNLEGVSWMDEQLSLPQMIVRLAGVLSRTFVDLGVSPTDSRSAMIAVAPLILLTLGASFVAMIVMIRRTPLRVWLFVATLAGVTGSVIILSYLVLGKQIATTRYILPISLSMHLAVAYLLVESARFTHRIWGKAIAWQALGAVIVSVGVLSCAIRLNAPIWWNQVPEIHRNTPAVAQVLNQHPNSLVLVDATTGEFNLLIMQGLIPSLRQPMEFQVIDKADPKPLMQPQQRDTFIYFPFTLSPESLKETLTKKYGSKPNVKLEPVLDPLWRVTSQ